MPAPALRLFYDLSEGSKFHFRFDLDRSIFFVERYQLNIIFVLLIFFNISVTVQIEDSDIAIFQLVLLMNPLTKEEEFHELVKEIESQSAYKRVPSPEKKYMSVAEKGRRVGWKNTDRE